MIKKHIAEAWTLFNDNERRTWLATVLMDNDVGQISIQSDWGNYAYAWYRSGRGTKTLREFLAWADDGYVMNKFSYGMPKQFDPDKSIEVMKRDLFRARRGYRSTMMGRKREITKDEAREIYNSIEDLETSNGNPGEWYYHVQQCAELLVEKLYGGDVAAIPCVSCYDAQLVEFMKRVWPIFKAECKAELEREQPPAETL